MLGCDCRCKLQQQACEEGVGVPGTADTMVVSLWSYSPVRIFFFHMLAGKLRNARHMGSSSFLSRMQTLIINGLQNF